MRRFFSAVLSQITLAVLLLTGCAQVAPLQPSEQPPTSVEATAAAPALKPTAPAPPSSPSITRMPTSTPKSNAPSLALRVTSPQDDSIVNIASIPVIGQTTTGAVVSVNGNLADVDAAGKFQKTVMLDEGTNIIEVVASDENGTELNVILLVIYEP